MKIKHEFSKFLVLVLFSLINSDSLSAKDDSEEPQAAQLFTNTKWDISYEDSVLGVVEGTATISDSLIVSGYYRNPLKGTKHEFTGVANPVITEGIASVDITLETTGPYAPVQYDSNTLLIDESSIISASIGNLETSLKVSKNKTVILSLEYEEEHDAFIGLWRASNKSTTSNRNGSKTISFQDKQYSADTEVWLHIDSEFNGKAEVRAFSFSELTNKSTRGKFEILIEGINLPDLDQINNNSIKFHEAREYKIFTSLH